MTGVQTQDNARGLDLLRAAVLAKCFLDDTVVIDSPEGWAVTQRFGLPANWLSRAKTQSVLYPQAPFQLWAQLLSL